MPAIVTFCVNSSAHESLIHRLLASCSKHGDTCTDDDLTPHVQVLREMHVCHTKMQNYEEALDGQVSPLPFSRSSTRNATVESVTD